MTRKSKILLYLSACLPILAGCDPIDKPDDILEDAFLRAVLQDDNKWWLCPEVKWKVEDARPERKTQIGKIVGVVEHKSCHSEDKEDIQVSLKYQFKDGIYAGELMASIIEGNVVELDKPGKRQYFQSSSVSWTSDEDIDQLKSDKIERMNREAENLLLSGGNISIQNGRRILLDMLGEEEAGKHFLRIYKKALKAKNLSAIPLRKIARSSDKDSVFAPFANVQNIDLANAIGKNGNLQIDTLTDDQLFYLSLALRAKNGPSLDLSGAITRLINSYDFRWSAKDEFELRQQKETLKSRMQERYLGYLVAIWDLDLQIARSHKGGRSLKYDFGRQALPSSTISNPKDSRYLYGDFQCGYSRFIKSLPETKGLDVGWPPGARNNDRSGFAEVRFFEAEHLCQNTDGALARRWANLKMTPDQAQKLFEKNDSRTLNFSYVLKPSNDSKNKHTWQHDISYVPWAAHNIRVSNPATGYGIVVRK